MANIKRRHFTSGIGLLFEFIGLLFLFTFIFLGPLGLIGIPIGLVLIAIGNNKSIQLICSECGNGIEHKKVKICPVCKVEF